MRLLAFIGFVGIVAAICAAVFFFGGFYSVAGTAPEPAIVKWALVQVRTASIMRHADGPPSSVAFDDAAVMAGARAYAARGCVSCHGAPGAQWAKFAEGMQPSPPDLADVAKERSPAQLFWVIKNGINMTGMPSFSAIEVPDKELWTIAAFVKKLPSVTEADYKAWTARVEDVIRPLAPIPNPPAPDAGPPSPIPTPPAPDATPPAPDAAPKPPN